MGYYGNGMALSGSYCIHYGRKGMKWYQNIFADLTSSVANGYRGAQNRAGYENQIRTNQRAAAAGANTPAAAGMKNYQAQLNKAAAQKYTRNGYNGYNRSYASYNGVSSANSAAMKTDGGYGRNATLIKVGDAIGTTAYNATVLGRNIAKFATKTWNEAKTTFSHFISKGREILSKLIGSVKSKATSASKTATSYAKTIKTDAENTVRKGLKQLPKTYSGQTSAGVRTNSVNKQKAANPQRVNTGYSRKRKVGLVNR